MVLTDIDEQKLRAAVTDLTGAGHKVLGVAGDIADAAFVKSLMEQTLNTYGRLDAAFNNAGIQSPAVETADVGSEVFDQVNAINLRGVWLCMKYQLQQMRGESGKVEALLRDLSGKLPESGSLSSPSFSRGEREKHSG